MSLLEYIKDAAEGRKPEDDRRAITEAIVNNPALLLPPVGGILGASLSDRKATMLDKIRNVIHGTVTGAGALAGGAIGSGMSESPTTGMVTGGAIGGIASFLAARRALNVLFGSQENPRKSLREKYSSSSALQGLLEAKNRSDVKDYRGKYMKLHQLIAAHPDDFFIDSESGNIVGITHKPTGFRIHASRSALPGQLQKLPKHPLEESETVNAN